MKEKLEFNDNPIKKQFFEDYFNKKNIEKK